MVLNVEGLEIEIRGGSFVCIDDGSKTHFCEWTHMDPKLQDTFRSIKGEIQTIVENFITSDKRSVFDSVAEQYMNEQQTRKQDCIKNKACPK